MRPRRPDARSAALRPPNRYTAGIRGFHPSDACESALFTAMAGSGIGPTGASERDAATSWRLTIQDVRCSTCAKLARRRSIKGDGLRLEVPTGPGVPSACLPGTPVQLPRHLVCPRTAGRRHQPGSVERSRTRTSLDSRARFGARWNGGRSLCAYSPCRNLARDPRWAVASASRLPRARNKYCHPTDQCSKRQCRRGRTRRRSRSDTVERCRSLGTFHWKRRLGADP
jgi:hypothetical protein